MITQSLYVGFFTHPDYHVYDLTNIGSVSVVKMRNGSMRFKFESHVSNRVFYCKSLEYMQVLAKRFYGVDCKFIA